MIRITTLLLCILIYTNGFTQEIIPLDTSHWDINGDYILENFHGKNAIYNKGGYLRLKNEKFLNGTIEFDLFLKNVQMFPGVRFRGNGNNAEEFYVRPHLSGKPDGTQAGAVINNITPWQLYFGPRYSFAHEYKYDDWTHVKLVVNGTKAQVYLDNSEKPHHSWNLFLEPKEGYIILTGGFREGVHIADVKIDKTKTDIIDFNPIDREPIEGIITEWEISDMFDRNLLNDPNNIQPVINGREWKDRIGVDEGTAANIARVHNLYNGQVGETVFARITIDSDKDQLKLFEFGYSDDVIAILNGQPIYKGTNLYKSRDYRYLGTIGLFDAIYLPLKKGKNTLLMAVSENFGGWLVTGRFTDQNGIKIK